MKNQFKYLFCASFILFGWKASAQTTDANTPLHLLEPDYPTSYGAPQEDSVKEVLNRVYNYLEENTASGVINLETGETISDIKNQKGAIDFDDGAFRLTSYEW